MKIRSDKVRILLLLRGSAGCGKSTWIEKNGLKPYTLSADDIRLLCQSPIMQVDGTEGISQANDNLTWKTLFNLLETRMQKGEFTVIDATNSKTSEMNRYKEMCNTYRYRIYCVDFTDIPIEEVKRRNANREPLKRVPEETIDKMYSRFATQKIPSGIKVIKPNELNTIWMKMFDLSEYKKIHHIGDIHGCNTALQKYLVLSYFDIKNFNISNKNWDYCEDEYWKKDRWLSLENFDNEEWKNIDGYEGLYQVNNYGRVKSLQKQAGFVKNGDRILKASPVATYLQVVLSKDGKHKNCKVHKLVAEAFIKNDKDLRYVNHKDLNRYDNNVENLEWVTSKENVNYSVNLGSYNNTIVGQYDKNNNFIKAYISIEDASRQTGIDNRAISKVCKHVDKYITAGGYIWKSINEMDYKDFIIDDNFYVFTGDYIDRGLENADVVNFLISIKDKKNVLMLEGNHERWLWLYANDCVGKSKEFELVTKPQLDDAKIDKKDIRQLYRKFGQCAYYKYGDNVYLVTHAGLSTMPKNLSYVATDQMIRGVGNYNDFEKIAETWLNTTQDNFYQIHGHRNTKRVPIQVNDRVFNLEGRIEFGGELRCVQIDKKGIHTIEVQNEVFKTPEMQREQTVTSSSVADTIIALRSNRYIQEKKFGNISSFNFTNKAFYDKVWDEQTTKARGLYLDTMKGKVAARAYDKFFNINERPETKFDMLQYKLQFPVTTYVKENGFLGIVSYNEYEDDLFVASKSTIDSQFAQWFKDMLYEKVSSDNLMKMKEFIKENNVSFVFECVDMKNDPHIIEYPESELFLLDIVRNDMEFSKYEYDQMVDIANQFGLTHKEKAFEIATWQEFYDWYYDILEEDYEYNGRKIEGFVIEDSVGYMTKLKLTYYNFWKFMRSISHEAIRNGYIRKTSALTTPTANEFYAWVRKLHDVEDKDSIPKDICTLRRLFYKDKESA